VNWASAATKLTVAGIERPILRPIRDVLGLTLEASPGFHEASVGLVTTFDFFRVLSLIFSIRSQCSPLSDPSAVTIAVIRGSLWCLQLFGFGYGRPFAPRMA
jgi:hypothetical protein